MNPNNENPKAFPAHDTTTKNNPANSTTTSTTTSNTNKEQTTFNSLLPDHQQHQQHTGTHPRTHRQP
jgi:hypothetical protein